jgi:hypothetical protein
VKPWTRLQQARDGICFIVGGIIILARLALWLLVWALAWPITPIINIVLRHKQRNL